MKDEVINMYEAIENSVKSLQAAQKKITEFIDGASIEALIILFEMMLGQTDEEFEGLTNEQKQSVIADVTAADFGALSKTDKRQVLQFLLVGTIHQDGLQANYQVTPDAIGMWVTLIASAFIGQKTDVTLKDLALGTGNLMATVSQSLQAKGTSVEAIGIENDDTMLTVASGVAALLEEKWDITLADSVTMSMQNDADIVVGDLPVGYYPKTAPEKYETRVEKGLTFVHHLLIEQSVAAVKPGGLVILTVPTNLFESDQSKSLLRYIQTDDVYFQALLQLPNNLFKDPKMGKVILILQRSGGDSRQAKPVMLAKAPTLSDKAENKNFVTELTDWMKANHVYMH